MATPRALSTVRQLTIRLESPVLGEGSDRSWIQIARTGEWKGHGSGPFELTTKELSEMVRNFDEDGEEVPVVLGHPDDETPAYGWIHELDVRGGGSELWALVEWDPEFAEQIRKRRFRGCSMVFSTESIHRETGEERGAELFELGITNRPFISGMAEIRASSRPQRRKRKMSIDKKKIAEAIAELPDDATPEQFHMALKGALLQQAAQDKPEEPKPEEMPAEMANTAPVAASVDASVKAAEDAPPAPEDAAAGAQAEIAGALEKATGLAGADLLAFIADNSDKIGALAKGEPESGAPAEDRAMSRDFKLSAAEARAENAEAKVVKLSEELASYREREKAEKEKEIDVLVSDAINSGAILPTMKETFLRLGRLDRDGLVAELAKFNANKSVPVGKIVKSSVATAHGPDAELVPQDDVEREILRLAAKQSPQFKRNALRIHRERNGRGQA